MAEATDEVRALVAAGLAAADLRGEPFDREEIALDLADRLEVDAGLDEFVGVGDPGAPIPFDAVEPR